MQPVISIRDLNKTYAGGFEALKAVDLDISKGEIFGLLGPNGAGKTTLINIVCGIVTKTGGSVSVDGFDNVTDFRQTRPRRLKHPMTFVASAAVCLESHPILITSRKCFGPFPCGTSVTKRS